MIISIVTPSYNQAAYLEASMLSVLNQEGVDVEYVVMDGASTDESPAIIQKHAARLAHWESARDGGQYDAVNRGFSHTRGEIMGWINSDDLLCPWGLSVVHEIFSQCPEVEWLTTSRQIRWDDRGRAVRCISVPGFSRAGFLRGEHLPQGGAFSVGWIQQESTFWRRSLWEKAGSQVGAGYSLAGDFELWARFYSHAELYSVDTPLGGFRFHGVQRSEQQNATYMQQAHAALVAHGGRRMHAFEQILRNAGTCLPRSVRNRLAGVGMAREGCCVRHNRRTREWRTERYVF